MTEIRLNNGLVARIDNMFMGYRYDIHAGLKQFGNILELEFASPLRIIRQRQKPDDAEEWNDPSAVRPTSARSLAHSDGIGDRDLLPPEFICRSDWKAGMATGSKLLG